LLFLNELIKNINVLQIDGDDRIEIKGIAYSSNTVKEGFLFVAVPGFNTDGHLYINQAVRAGAVAVLLMQKDTPVPRGVTRVLVDNSRIALAQVSAAYYGFPSRQMRVVGVTGTNGKTTTTTLISSIYRSAGCKTGLIGTIANYIGDKKLDVRHTTPESTDLQKLLRDMVDNNVSVAVIEVSSHGLALERVTGCEYDIGVFTNLTQDHLDFHRDMEDYFCAKMKLFKNIGRGVKKQPKYIVVNRDDPYADRIILAANVPVVTYGLSGRADIRARNVKNLDRGSSFEVEGDFGSISLNIKLAGRFNVYNALAAFAVGLLDGFDPRFVADTLAGIDSVPGRFELIDRGQDFTVVVDYAHTPDGLENILKSARAITKGRLIVVFGCGGDRDRTKRPVMGEIAGRYCELPIVTSDNPRTEDPLVIIEDVVAGLKKILTPDRYRVIPDRREAIREAIREAKKGDTVVLAGKGHENYQIIGRRKMHFDDHEEAEKLLESLAAGK